MLPQRARDPSRLRMQSEKQSTRRRLNTFTGLIRDFDDAGAATLDCYIALVVT